MAFIRCKRRMTRLRTFMIMGFVWVGLATFGLIFDPERKLVILSLFIFGVLYLAYFLVIMRIPVLELSDEVILVHKRLFGRERIRVDQILNVEENPKEIILHIKDNQDVVIQRVDVQSHELKVFLDDLKDRIYKTQV